MKKIREITLRMLTQNGKWAWRDTFEKYAVRTKTSPLCRIPDGVWRGGEGDWMAEVRNRQLVRYFRLGGGDAEDLLFGHTLYQIEYSPEEEVEFARMIEDAYHLNALFVAAVAAGARESH